MKSGARIVTAVGFGYLLGRRKKLRTALTLAAAVAAGRASQQPGGLKKIASDLVSGSPQLGGLAKLGGPLAAAGKAAATAAAGNGIDAVSGKLRGGADALRRKSPGQTDQSGGNPEAAEGSAPDDEQELDEQPDARDDEGSGDERRDEKPVAARRGRGR
jgi:hypothetical protein